jgi:cell wall-associated NlpC family hydrolase
MSETRQRGMGFQPMSFWRRKMKTRVENPCHGILALALVVLVAGCKAGSVSPAGATTRPTTSASVTFADVLKRLELDDRLTLCDVWQKPDGSIAGFVEMPQYRDALKKAGFDVSDVKLMPEEASTKDQFGIVTVNHAILRKFPKDQPGDRDNSTDLTRGEPVWILDRKADGATLVHASDGYLGWVPADAIQVIDGTAFEQVLGPTPEWKRATPVFEPPSTAPTAIPSSTMKQLTIISQAQLLLGTPYLWGGKTPDGIDCSGLVQSTFARYAILPRDADQQANVGRLVAMRWFKDALLPGDLLFFVSPRRGNVHHVAIYLGDNKYIEAAGKDVHISSMKPGDAEYDAERTATFGWARRVIE